MAQKPTRKRSKPVDNTREQAEKLNSIVRMDGVGEDPVIKALVSDEFVKASDSDALDVALLLQQVIRGQNSLLGKQDEMSEQLNKLRGRMDSFDRAAKAWETDREKFLSGVDERAEGLRIDDPKAKERLIAKEAQNIQMEIQKQRARNSVDKLQFQQNIEAQEKVIIVSPGVWETVNLNGVIQQVCEPETIKIRHLAWTLQPNVPTSVPKLVADEFYSRQRIRSDSNERKALLNANTIQDSTIVAQKWAELNKKYAVGGDAFRADPR